MVVGAKPQQQHAQHRRSRHRAVFTRQLRRVTRNVVRIACRSKCRSELLRCRQMCPRTPIYVTRRACRTSAAQVRALCGALRVRRIYPAFARSPRKVFSWAGCQMPQEQCPGENGQQTKHTFTHRAVSPSHNGYGMHHFAPLFASPINYASAENRSQVRPMATMCSATGPLMLSNKKRSICACRIGLPKSFFTHESSCGQ